MNSFDYELELFKGIKKRLDDEKHKLDESKRRQEQAIKNLACSICGGKEFTDGEVNGALFSNGKYQLEIKGKVCNNCEHIEFLITQ